ncbi:hypothetical protein KIH74_09380 [Kineosporia sp. J2-2]|uniref:Sodium/calcium exchanger membrane region domain-containing protein n=1 Tax=Kineosporia corallincola TaxID=2835133 RepID=A0ABS5TDG8_9ACTN|nr:hypothetical protein [Kineosporia corallincola]MBT0769129.1 hypothetical protein [Kineosporia corallincola]
MGTAPPGRVLARSLSICAVFALPAVVMRAGGLHSGPVLSMVVFGTAVVAASFLLAWAAESAQVDISGGLAIAVLALIAVLPEYAVDLYYAWTAGSNPDYVQYAAANMTGSNRLLLGLGWPVVVLAALAATKRLTGKPDSALRLERGNRLELGFLLTAGVAAFWMPLSGGIQVWFGVLLLLWFVFYLVRLASGEVEEPHLIGTAAALGGLPRRRRRIVVPLLFVVSAAVILLCAEPFAESLVQAGTDMGIDQFLLVQWLAPLSSEAPEFIIAIIFASRGNGADAIATLISSKVNQWTLLVGSLPIVYFLGGGGITLHLDDRQVEEMLLTATQTMMGVAMLLTLRFHRWSAWALLALFAVQFPITGTEGRLILSGVYAAVALALFAHRRRMIPATLAAPWKPPAAQETTTPSAARV